MQKGLSYAIFSTAWGYFGLAGDNGRLYRTCLPMGSSGEVKQRLLCDIQGQSMPQPELFPPLQASIQAYFAGKKVDFGSSPPLGLEAMTAFSRSVLLACAAIPCGKTVDYATLARQAGSPHAARAVGNALARNPVPLSIPCHRVVARSGRIGGFSGAGGTATKKRLLQHEAQLGAQ